MSLSRRVGAAILLAVLAAGGLLAGRRTQIAAAAQAYLFGYPLVIMDLTRAATVASLGPENALLRVRAFPGVDAHDVVRPNVDTLYTTAFIDMQRGPWIFESAPNAERYEVLPFLDAWTNVFAAPGTRTGGAAGVRYLLAARDWRGEVPPGLTLLRAPTRMVWLIGRTQTNGMADYPLVHRLQDRITLRPFAAPAANAPTTPWRRMAKSAAPIEQMRAMSTVTFFTRLAALLPDNPASDADRPMMAQLATLGVAPGRAPAWTWLDALCIDLGRRIADYQVGRALRQARALVRGWSTPPSNIGNYGTDYATRAVVAMVGLGANLPADALYPNARVDGAGEPLDGDRRYRLHFARGALPPVRAFWSVTAYGPDDFLIPNPIDRHALGDRDRLTVNADGSLDIAIQASAPTDPRANWLPVRAGQAFTLNARLYWPEPAALDGRWGMPAIERVVESQR